MRSERSASTKVGSVRRKVKVIVISGNLVSETMTVWKFDDSRSPISGRTSSSYLDGIQFSEEEKKNGSIL